MRYSLRQKLISIGGDSIIKDGQGRDAYYVDGAAISLGRRLTLKDMQGKEAATIQQQLIAFTPSYEIHVRGGVKAHVSMKIISITDRLKIDVPGWNDLEARGDLFHHEYEIQRGGRRVAQISRAWIALTDSYGIDIADDEDQVLLLCCAVVIDEILDLKERGEREK